MNKKPLIVIEGPTAVGKSDVGVEVAKRIGGEIISADSMQVYKYMDIGTGKITEEEMQGILHYMLSVCDPRESFDISRYVEGAKKALKKIYENGNIPIIVGGTGFYIQAVTHDIDFSEGSPETKYRNELEELAVRKGNIYLHDILKKVDVESAEAIHPNNVKKVIRALEYYKTTGEKLSLKNERDKKQVSPYDLQVFFLNMDRGKLYERTELRVDKMVESGLLNEVKALKNMGLTRDHVSMQGLGYKEILDYFAGKTSLEEALAILKKNTRHYAKRQLTWFNHDPDARKVMREDYGNDNVEIAEHIVSVIRNHTS